MSAPASKNAIVTTTAPQPVPVHHLPTMMRARNFPALPESEDSNPPAPAPSTAASTTTATTASPPSSNARARLAEVRSEIKGVHEEMDALKTELQQLTTNFTKEVQQVLMQTVQRAQQQSSTTATNAGASAQASDTSK